MNILFITSYYPEPKIGGIERVTYILSEYLSEHGYKIFNLRFFNSDYDNSFSFLESEILKSKDNHNKLREYLVEKKIDFIINQSHFFYTPTIDLARKGLDIKLFTVFHNRPMFEALCLKEAVKYSSSNVKYIIPFVYPLYKWYSVRKLRKEHKKSYELSDKTILLSSSFFNSYKTELGIDGSKLFFINNPISFKNITVDYSRKEKIVLIVSRLYEAQKKLSIALKIWKDLEKQIPEWKLVIVGEGEDKNTYINYCKKNNLNRVIFTGRTDPIPYYLEASIFMMTSKNEGWPLTLLEAQQTGVVPIVIDSFAALHDIVEDGYNGFIISQGNYSLFKEKLSELICDEELLKKLSMNAQISCKKFSIDNICRQWIQLLN